VLWLTAGWLGSDLCLAQITLPQIDASYEIHVRADEIAKERRGSYDVLAFSGRCQLTQGALIAEAKEIILWIERSLPDEPNQPGKIICYCSGDVQLNWNEQQSMRDQNWMGRLYSLYPVRYEAQREVRRFDIPDLDWSREPSGMGAIQLAQFAQSSSGTSVVPANVPQLLNAPASPSKAQGNSNGVLPAPTRIVPTPGATTWENNQLGSTSGRSDLPSVGLVIPEDGSSPYPAANPLPSRDDLAPAFPSAPTQVVRQVPAPNPLGVKSVQFFQRNANSRIEFRPDPNTGEHIAEIRGGFKLVVTGIQLTQPDGSIMDFGTISLEADNAVVWLHSQGPIGDLFQNMTSTPDRPIELYLDGNIVFNQGNRMIYADRMYYNISSEYGMVLSAEMLAYHDIGFSPVKSHSVTIDKSETCLCCRPARLSDRPICE
jgi:hypothetical protein